MTQCALVTGGAGFVGANLVRALLQRGDEVHLLQRPGRDLWRLTEVLSEVRVHDGSIEDEQTIRHAFEAARPETVFHCAAYGAYPSQRDRATALHTNTVGTARLATLATEYGVAAFINTGSSSEYGFTDHPPVEDEAVDPVSGYAATKAAATLIVRQLAREQNAHLVTLRLYSAYGPWEAPTRLIPALISEGLDGRLPPLVDGRIARDLVYVEDVCAAILLAAAAGHLPRGSVLNVGSGHQRSVADIVATARAVFDVREQPQFGSMPNRDWDTAVWVANPDRARRLLGWEAITTLDDGLRRTAWWLQNAPGMLNWYRTQRMARG